MTRLIPYTTLVILAAALGSTHGGDKEKGKEKPKDLRFERQFTKDDARDQARGGPSQVHAVPLKAGHVYTIDMVSKELDSYLRLLDPKGNQLEEDDDSGGNLNARIIFNCTKDGDYKIVATTFNADPKGSNYVLTVKATGGVPTPSTGHTQMIGKPAPDLRADFAVGGKPVALPDLKSKVVVVNFWDVRSGACQKYLPHLTKWHAEHAKAGLVVLGVSFYPSEIGQKLGFDPEEGRITTVKKADRKSDQAFLMAFAKHHKLPYRLLVQSKDEALLAYDAYVVNGVPQTVLIDRKGMVRLIDVGGEKSSANVEEKLKELLAEK